MGYQVQVVADDALGGLPWVFAQDGTGKWHLLMTRSAMTHDPCRHLSAAWRCWEDQRELVPA